MRNTKKTNVCILPCAGEGARLGLPYPKEIHHIDQDVALIDLSFHLLSDSNIEFDRIIVVTVPDKYLLLKHIEKKWSYLPIIFVYFNKNYYEWAGSVKSANNLFGDNNMVLLPDTLLVPFSGQDICSELLAGLKRTDLVMGVKAETNIDVLSRLGAVLLEDTGQVTEFQDKPTPDQEHFNGFWTCFAFSSQSSSVILDYMMQSIQHTAPSFGEASFDASGFWVKDYSDFGTWPNLHRAADLLVRSGRLTTYRGKV